MAAGEPGIFVDDAAQQVLELVIGALPECPEGAGRGDDRVIMDAILGADLGDAVGHAGAAGDAVDEALGAFEDAVQHTLGAGHFPQHVHVQAAVAAHAIMGDAGLGDAALDRVVEQFLMAVAARLAVIDLRDRLAVLVIGIGIDAGEGADAAGQRPGAGGLPVRDGNALAAFNERQDLASRNDQRLQ